MSRLLAQQLRRVARDRTSGAAQVALQAVHAAETWLARHAHPSESECEELVMGLLRVQSSMAPILRLANEVALAADAPNRGKSLAAALRRFRRGLEGARGKIARHLLAALEPASPAPLATYSYSSTVTYALAAARSRLSGVLVAECDPGREGRITARLLARSGVRVEYTSDPAWLSLLPSCRALLLGADAVLSHAFVNKIGTRAAYLVAREAGIPVWVLCDSTKFLPEELAAPFWRPREGPGTQLWAGAPRGVEVRNPLIEHTELVRVRVVTEAGFLEPPQVRVAVEAVKLSPRLKRLAD
jgi:translation initiation factor 2B subunit (eIF-2B alpha/beta/delta family)